MLFSVLILSEKSTQKRACVFLVLEKDTRKTQPLSLQVSTHLIQIEGGVCSLENRVVRRRERERENNNNSNNSSNNNKKKKRTREIAKLTILFRLSKVPLFHKIEVFQLLKLLLFWLILVS